MKLHVDPEADALYLRLNESKIIESEEVSPGVVLDYDAKEEVVGVEILFLSSRGVDTDKLDFKRFARQHPVRWLCGKHHRLTANHINALAWHAVICNGGGCPARCHAARSACPKPAGRGEWRANALGVASFSRRSLGEGGSAFSCQLSAFRGQL